MKYSLVDNSKSNGTSKQGTVAALYHYLVYHFGEPTKTSKRSVTCEWVIQFSDGLIATIYDWHTNVPCEMNKIWTIGGKNFTAAARIIDILEGRL